MQNWTRLVAVVLAVVGSSGGCNSPDAEPYDEPGTCLLIGCFSGVTWAGSVELPATPTRTLHVELCKNAGCALVVLNVDGEGTSFSDSSPTGLPYCIAEPAKGGIELSCRFEMPAEELNDGDALELTLTLVESDEVLVHVSRTASYEEYRSAEAPCGEVCRRVSLDDED